MTHSRPHPTGILVVGNRTCPRPSRPRHRPARTRTRRIPHPPAGAAPHPSAPRTPPRRSR